MDKVNNKDSQTLTYYLTKLKLNTNAFRLDNCFSNLVVLNWKT
jgi:hypothetical protein